MKKIKFSKWNRGSKNTDGLYRYTSIASFSVGSESFEVPVVVYAANIQGAVRQFEHSIDDKTTEIMEMILKNQLFREYITLEQPELKILNVLHDQRANFGNKIVQLEDTMADLERHLRIEDDKDSAIGMIRKMEEYRRLHKFYWANMLMTIEAISDALNCPTYLINRELIRLREMGLVKKTDDTFMITNEGLEAILNVGIGSRIGVK